MEQTKNNPKILNFIDASANRKFSANHKLIVICNNCGKPIKKVQLIGLSLICPSCGKPQNGQLHIDTEGNPNLSLVC